MFQQRQLPSPKSAQPDDPAPPQRQIFVAHPAKDGIIDLEPETPAAVQHAPKITRSPRAQAVPPRRASITPDDAFSGVTHPRYEEYGSQQNPRPWGMHINQENPEQIFVTFYGSRWMLLLMFFAMILIGFSLEKVPEFLPKVVDLFL